MTDDEGSVADAAEGYLLAELLAGHIRQMFDDSARVAGRMQEMGYDPVEAYETTSAFLRKAADEVDVLVARLRAGEVPPPP